MERSQRFPYSIFRNRRWNLYEIQKQIDSSVNMIGRIAIYQEKKKSKIDKTIFRKMVHVGLAYKV